MHKYINCGGFGKVYLIVEKKTGEIYAAKVSHDEIKGFDDIEYMNFLSEVTIIANLAKNFYL